MSSVLQKAKKAFIEKHHQLRRKFFDAIMDKTKIDGSGKFSFGKFMKLVGAKLNPQDEGKPYDFTIEQLKQVLICADLSNRTYDLEFSSPEEAGKIIYQNTIEETYKLPMHVTYNETTHTLYIVFRGTLSFADIITDLTATLATFEDGFVHSGVLETAESSIDESIKIIEESLKTDNELKVILTGHSLGGATSGLILHRLKENFPDMNIKAILFAPPPSLSKNLWEVTRNEIISFHLNDDPVPFCSLHNAAAAAADSLPQSIGSYFAKIAEKDELIPPGEVYKIQMVINNPKATKTYKTDTEKHYTRLASGLNESHHSMQLYFEMIRSLIDILENPPEKETITM
ncbi:Lipase family protein [Trichomonas vaginalis G3]|uniref:sn-1-specific diacylglycerol lipase n=1 Tax=Trichomonas vaginalis (strain ATCC PRA-98 / G3) TaxID=412133 RepID=A2FZK3_TRIV3|nr:lipase [Trichomonas vaginalis G3]EAX89661.1 Lipase family protein [Trichomonas vaginalis G3]KAI5495861.1 retrograde trans-synaptic signaling by lipid [Trichomonas vaginalis G3]|eukprot:XP_001302591.1 lipase [Trichomonas vaginalis G3]